MQNRFSLLDMDVMPMFMIIALDVFIIMRCSINCSAVICSPTVIHAILREDTSETYGPGSLSYYIASLLFTLHLIYYFAIFTFQSIQQKYQKYLLYYLYEISLLRVTVKGLTTPLSRWLRGFICCVGARDLRVASYWIDTFVLKN